MRQLSPAQRETILAAIATGATVEAAAGAAGCSRRSISRWRRRGEQDDATPEELDFSLRYGQAEARAEIEAIRVISEAADGPGGDWRAAAWFLTHRFPERWSEKRTIVVEQPDRPDGAALVADMLRQVREDMEARGS